MSDTTQATMNVAQTADRNAFAEEAIEVASQWAQEKVENFMNDIEYDIKYNQSSPSSDITTEAMATITSYSR